MAEGKLNDRTEGYQIYWIGTLQFKKCYLKLNPTVHPESREQINILRQRFVQTLGYFHIRNDFPCTSYFSDGLEGNDSLTDEDLELLQYHYSYGICKGTHLEEFEDHHRRAGKMLSKNPNNSMGFMHKVK